MDKKKERILDLFLLIVIIICIICLGVFTTIRIRNNYMANMDDADEVVHVFREKVIKTNINVDGKKLTVLIKTQNRKKNLETKPKNNDVLYACELTTTKYSPLVDGNYKYEFKFKGQAAKSDLYYDEDQSSLMGGDDYTLIHYDSIKIKDYQRHKEYDITNFINNDIDRSIFYRGNGTFGTYDAIKLFNYKNHLFLAVSPNGGNQLIKKDAMLGYKNKDMTQHLIKDQTKIFFKDLENNKLYSYDYLEFLHREYNPYQQLLLNTEYPTSKVYCVEKDDGNFQLVFVNSISMGLNKKVEKQINKKIDNKKTFIPEIAFDINKNNFDEIIKLTTIQPELNYKNIVIDKQYSVDGKKHIVNTKDEFKRYIKC